MLHDLLRLPHWVFAAPVPWLCLRGQLCRAFHAGTCARHVLAERTAAVQLSYTLSYNCTARWDEWDEKIHGDSETRNWFMANTKPCPKCSKPVEKNGGCNLVMCKCGQVRARGVEGGNGGATWSCASAGRCGQEGTGTELSD